MYEICTIKSVVDPEISKPEGGGGGGPGALEFLAPGLGFGFDILFTHTLCFLVTVENKVHIVSTLS